MGFDPDFAATTLGGEEILIGSFVTSFVLLNFTGAANRQGSMIILGKSCNQLNQI